MGDDSAPPGWKWVVKGAEDEVKKKQARRGAGPVGSNHCRTQAPVLEKDEKGGASSYLFSLFTDSSTRGSVSVCGVCGGVWCTWNRGGGFFETLCRYSNPMLPFLIT